MASPNKLIVYTWNKEKQRLEITIGIYSFYISRDFMEKVLTNG